MKITIETIHPIDAIIGYKCVQRWLEIPEGSQCSAPRPIGQRLNKLQGALFTNENGFYITRVWGTRYHAYAEVKRTPHHQERKIL